MEFKTPEEAARWLEEKLDTLENTVRQAADLRRLTQEGTREVLVDVDARPHIFAQDVHERVRRYTSQVHQSAIRRLERDGFQRRALERACLAVLGDRYAHGRLLIRAMAQVLRTRTELHSDEGTKLFEESRSSLDEGSDEIARKIGFAYDVWAESHESVLPWRSNTAAQNNPMEDATFRQSATEAVDGKTEVIERSLGRIAHATVLIAMSKYYGEIGSLLSDYLAVAQNLHERGQVLHLEAQQKLDQLRRSTSLDSSTSRSSDTLFLDDATLDTVLDELHVDASHFLLNNDVSIADLAELDRATLAENLSAWVEHQLGNLSAPSLAQALGGASGDDATLLEKTLQYMASGQPLAHFNDDIALQFEGGQRAHTAVIVEATDASLRSSLFEACRQIGYPDPQWTQVPANTQGEMSMRILQCAAGMPVFAMADRLLPWVERHRATLSGDTPVTRAPHISPSVLRDMSSSQDLLELVPKEVVDAFRHEKSLNE